MNDNILKLRKASSCQVVHIVKSSLSNVPLLAKGRSVTWVWAINKVTVRTYLQTIVVSSLLIFFPASSLQTLYDDGPDPDLYDDFNIDTHVENIEDWVGDDQIMELTCGNPSKMAEALALEVKLVLLLFPRTLTQFCSETKIGRHRPHFKWCRASLLDTRGLWHFYLDTGHWWVCLIPEFEWLWPGQWCWHSSC